MSSKRSLQNPRVAGAGLIALVALLIVLQFLGLGTITDTRLRIILEWACYILAADRAGRSVAQFASNDQSSQNNDQ